MRYFKRQNKYHMGPEHSMNRSSESAQILPVFTTLL